MMTSTTSSIAHSLRRPRRIDLRAVLGVALLLLATGGSIAFWSASSDSRPVVVAARDLPAGATLHASDLTTARVRLDEALYQAAIPADELDSLAGKPLAEPIHARQVLVRAQFTARPALQPGQMALTIAVSPDTAAGGSIHPGNAVEVLLTTDRGKPTSKTSVVLPCVTVIEVGHEARAAAINADVGDSAADQGPIQWLTLAVTQDQALQLAQAKWAGDLDVALLPPEQP